jgi:AcrR family transcriptional regulator
MGVTSTDAQRLGDIARAAAQTRVMLAALDLFGQHGVSGTSLQMIADAMGETKAAVYHQFKAKDEIIIAVTEMQLARLEAPLEDAEAADDRPQARELLLNRVIELAVEQRHMVGVMQSDPVIIRFLAEHNAFRPSSSACTPRIGDDLETLVQAAMLSGAIGSAVKHPLVAHLDDPTLRSHLLRLTRRLVDLPG